MQMLGRLLAFVFGLQTTGPYVTLIAE